MGYRKTSGLMAVFASAATVAAHGHVTNIVVNGVSYRNYIPVQDPYTSNPPLVAGWTIDQRDNGFVAPDAYNAPDIICHRQAVAGKGRITVAAGDTIQLQWTEWPDSHKGPVIDWLANCNGPCNLVDKTDLRFFKIDGAGLINPLSAPTAGRPAFSLKMATPGSAGQQNGAQSYPQCINLEITGEGTYNPPGTPGTALYKADDAGILYNIYRDNLNDYVIPGDAIISGGISMLPQSQIQITASGSATPYGTTRAVSSSSSTSRADTSSSSRAVTSSSVATVETSTTVLLTSTITATRTTSTSNIIPSSSTTAPSQTSAATTFQTLTTTAPPSGEPTQNMYGQCGGVNYAGPTKCPEYASCSTVNPYYAQCTPGPIPAGIQSLYGQCGGRNWPAESPTACVPGARCSTVNPYYAQCTPA
ncbi:endoglucanase-4 [Colletotrichum liriopes]|uniref:lytic cellulose monooxygenase (C4-dehydrogenating) n=1 Tax=Colletotrichum liriopes TaxID=708192 RepID=A0AA37LWW3_9PEZI|nr:endoglucanase-4 [Colletotrichum liriopes]